MWGEQRVAQSVNELASQKAIENLREYDKKDVRLSYLYMPNGRDSAMRDLRTLGPVLSVMFRE